MARDREDRVPGPAEVKVGTKVPVLVPVVVDKANGPDVVAAAARGVVVAGDRAAPDVEITSKADFRVF